MIQDLAEELQAIEQESFSDGHDSEITQESDLEQEDSEINLTEDEEQWLAKTQVLSATMFKDYEPNQYYKDVETTFC